MYFCFLIPAAWFPSNKKFTGRINCLYQIHPNSSHAATPPTLRISVPVYILMTEAEIVPDLITLNNVINCHCQRGRMDHAIKVIEGGNCMAMFQML